MYIPLKTPPNVNISEVDWFVEYYVLWFSSFHFNLQPKELHSLHTNNIDRHHGPPHHGPECRIGNMWRQIFGPITLPLSLKDSNSECESSRKRIVNVVRISKGVSHNHPNPILTTTSETQTWNSRPKSQTMLLCNLWWWLLVFLLSISSSTSSSSLSWWKDELFTHYYYD